jgi:hypothetical protein
MLRCCSGKAQRNSAVEPVRRFVEDEDRRVAEQRAGEPEALGRLGQGLEFVADLFGVRVLQVLEDGLGLFPGVTGGVVTTGGVVRVAEAGEGNGFLVAVPDRAEKIECLAVALDGLPVVAEVLVGVAETVECLGLPHLVAEVAVQGQGLLAGIQCLLMVAEQGA